MVYFCGEEIDICGSLLSPVRSKETNEMYAAMKAVMDGSYGDRHDLIDDTGLYGAAALPTNSKRLNLSVRYKGWNVLHIAAYHGAGSLMYELCGGIDNTKFISSALARSVCRPQRASVLMCIAHGKAAALSQHERDFEQAGFKLVYRMSDADLRYRDRSGCTALHYAAVHGVVDMVAALIERNVDLEARGAMDDDIDMAVGLRVVPTEEKVEGKGWVDHGPDRTRRTPLECAELRHQYMRAIIPDNANSQIALREVIELLRKAMPQPEVPTAVPIITKMLTVAMVPAGQTMNVATPKGPLAVVVPSGCDVGPFFQFDLAEPIPVADFRAWPRQIAVSTMTTVTTTSVATDGDGDGVVDASMVTQTVTKSTTAEMKDADGDGVADGVLALAA